MLSAFPALKIWYSFTRDECLAPQNPIRKLLKTTLTNTSSETND